MARKLTCSAVPAGASPERLRIRASLPIDVSLAAAGAFFFWAGLLTAASFTSVPRSLAAALSPSLGGALFAAGWLAAPLAACGALKIA